MNLAAHLWFILALGAAIFWGLGYAFTEKLMKDGLNPYLLLTGLVAAQVIAYPLFFYFGSADFKSQMDLFKNPKMIMVMMAAMAFFILGNAFIFNSIQMKNASLSNIIEISYPIFVVLFSWLIFKENHINIHTVIGGALIFSGVTLILLKS